MVDWYETFGNLAGARGSQPLPLDGRDAWAAIALGKGSPHDEILLNVEPDRGALRRGDFKLVVSGLLPLSLSETADGAVELFDLASDPYEKADLRRKEPARARELLERLNAYARAAAPPKGGARDVAPAGYKVPAVYGER